MNQYITEDTVWMFANTNEKLVRGPVKGIVLEFPGLGGGSCLGGTQDMGEYGGDYARALGENGILLIYPFPGPWSWMNKGAVRMIDAVVAAYLKRFSLENPKIVVSGGSMGGAGALIYAADGAYRVSACAAACPCFDVPDSVFRHPEFPRSFVAAASVYDGSIREALESFSPLHRLKDMPDIPYFILADGADEFFDAEGMRQYADQLREIAPDVEFRVMEGLGHGGFTPQDRQAFTDFVIREATGL